MSDNPLEQLKRRSRDEAFGELLGLKVEDVAPGYAAVRMQANERVHNIFGAVHGGALFGLMDEAFQLACNTHGVLSVALNVSITYVAAPEPGATLEARATEIYRTNRTASYACDVRELATGKLIATAQALAYRTGKPVGDF
jgi:acyl-CoA thioesterase